MITQSSLWRTATLCLLPICVVAETQNTDSQSETERVVIDDIVVTADFRERESSRMPVSVTTMDAGLIRDAAVQHFEELTVLVPNLNWSGDGHRARYFQIRGVGELEQYQGAPNPSVGFIIDDIDFSGIGTVATLFDIESVEVLRGTQASRYGANALGGLIYLRSTSPDSGGDNRAEMSVGDDDALSFGIAGGGSLDVAEDVKFRLSAHRHRSNGFRNNTWLRRNDTNGREETVLRGRLQWFPSERVEANIALLYANVDNGYDAFALDNGFTMLSDKPGRDAQESAGASVRLDWRDVAGGTLTSITSAAHSTIDFGFDADWGNDESWAPVLYDYVTANDRTRETVSQEFRFSSGEWLLGLYALRLSDDLDTLSTGRYYDPFYDFADSLNYPFASRYESTNIAAFGQYEFSLSDVTRLSAGLRIERRTSDYSDTDGLLAGPSESLWGGELSLSHDLRGDATAYLTLSRGYKAGGFNLGLVPDNRRRFDKEALWTAEAGVKGSALDSRLRYSVAAFHNWREDQQVRASFQLVANDPSSFGFATVNVDGATVWGLESDIRWFATDEFEMYAGAGLLYGSFPRSVAEFPWLRNREQAHAPNYSVFAGFVYRHPTGAFARLDVSVKDAFYFDVSHDQKSRAYSLANARVGYESENWTVSFWARNLFDRTYAVRGFYFGNEPPDFPDTLYTRPGDPRQLGVTLERRF